MDLTIDPRIVTSHADTSLSTRKNSDLAALKESSQEFEGLLLMEMLKAMRKAVPEGGLFEKSMARETFIEVLDMETCRQATKSKGLGLADEMFRQLAPLITNRRDP